MLIDKPIVKAILRAGINRSASCGGLTRFEHALMIYAGLSKPKSISCRFYSLLVSAIINLGLLAFKVKPHKLKKYLRDSNVRRGLTNVLFSVAEFGLTKPQVLLSPFLVVWNFTNACNLKCKHCYQSAGSYLNNELSLQEKLKVVEELDEAGVASLAISGGEPLMLKDHLFKVVHEASKRGMYVALATNGTLLTKNVVRKLKELGLKYVEVSLDSANPKIHDEFRGVHGAFEAAIRGIRNCVEEGLFTCIATTVTKLNVHEIPQIIELAKKLRVNRFIAFNFIPVGRGVDIVDLDLSPEEREKFLENLAKAALRGEIEVVSTAPQYARVMLKVSEGKCTAVSHFHVGSTTLTNYIKALAEFIGGCGAGRMYCAIQPNGDVTPCVFMPELVVGNLKSQHFIDIWKSSEVFKALRSRDKLKGHCGVCGFKYVCGGCRARALAYFNDILGPDPGCINNLRAYYDLIPKVKANIAEDRVAKDKV